MKLTFFGTSHGVPAADRFCSCTMLEAGGSIYFIDGGAPVLDLLLRSGRNINDFRAIFTTHVHSDHTFGVLPLADLINWYFKEASGDFFITEQPYIEAMKNMINASGSAVIEEDRVRFKLAHEGVLYEDENIKVEYIPTKHTTANVSYAILITEGEKRVLFGGDFSHWLKDRDVPEIIKENIDGFVCEMAHFGAEHIKPYLDTCNSARVFFNHVWPLNKYDDIEAMKADYPFEILTPSDGDSFEI